MANNKRVFVAFPRKREFECEFNAHLIHCQIVFELIRFEKNAHPNYRRDVDTLLYISIITDWNSVDLKLGNFKQFPYPKVDFVSDPSTRI